MKAGPLLVLSALLVLPATALHRATAGWNWLLVAGVCGAISVATFWAYASDKRRAREQKWRHPEWALHLLELLGGWPGAFLAQQSLRHKSSKVSYQIIFWLIVAAYEIASVNYLFPSLRRFAFGA